MAAYHSVQLMQQPGTAGARNCWGKGLRDAVTTRTLQKELLEGEEMDRSCRRYP